MADADAVDLLTGRFLMAFLSCGLVVVSKGVMIAMISSNVGSYFAYKDEENYSDLWAREVVVSVAAVVGLYVPNLILALWSSVGATKSSLKILIQDPSILLLPTFTFFTFAKINTFHGDKDVRVKFSSLYTVINMAWSFVYGLALMIALWETGCKEVYFFGEGVNTFSVWTPIFVSGMASTIIFLIYDSIFPCCCDCWLLPRGQVSVYDPDNPQLELVWRNGRVEEVFREGEKDIKENEEKIREVGEDMEMTIVVDAGQTMNVESMI